MKRWLVVILAVLLGACSLKMESRAPETVQSAAREMTAEERGLLASLEVARDNALQVVGWLIKEGNADYFLAQASLCGGNAFLCTQLNALTAEKRAFLEQNFLKAEAYVKERDALKAAKLIVTSDPGAVTVKGVVKTARANAATREITFFFPSVKAMSPAELVALLLHEIWHHLGLPDENAYGPFALTQDAINAAAAAQTVVWTTRTKPRGYSETLLFSTYFDMNNA